MYSEFTTVAADSVTNTKPDFQTLTTDARLSWAYGHYGDGLALMSSFGPQSIALIEQLHQAWLLPHIPIVTVDIKGKDWDAQRKYRAELQKLYGFHLHVLPAANETEKRSVLENSLKDLGITATLDGIRRSQTNLRATKSFIEDKPDRTHIHPLLDWADARTDYFIGSLSPHLRHPSWRPGIKSKGGVILAFGAEKTECGLHY
ncbi:MAG TPA: phosphoadenosine phosphosulfate reductase family protein [Alphaproteobacteria bacterium]